MKTKNLYKVGIDIKKGGRWVANWSCVTIVANGNLHAAINKAERVAKKQWDAEKAAANSIQFISEVDAV